MTSSTVELFGIYFSTFTRTIAMGLHELGIRHVLVDRPPHHADVASKNPFGRIPVLVHRPDGLKTPASSVVTLYESNAIRRYIDEQLHTSATSDAALTPSSTALERARVDQVVSLAASTLFPAAEPGFVKPYMSHDQHDTSPDDTLKALQRGKDELLEVMAVLEEIGRKNNGQDQTGGWFVGESLTWADLFVFPILRDVKATKLGDTMRTGYEECRFPWLASWCERVEARESARQTSSGTLGERR